MRFQITFFTILSIELARFNRSPKTWPDLISVSKNKCTVKILSQTNSWYKFVVNLLYREAKHLVVAIGKNGIFYVSALKSLKREFKRTFKLPFLELNQISIDDSKALRHFHQQIKGAVSCINSVGYVFPVI